MSDLRNVFLNESIFGLYKTNKFLSAKDLITNKKHLFFCILFIVIIFSVLTNLSFCIFLLAVNILFFINMIFKFILFFYGLFLNQCNRNKYFIEIDDLSLPVYAIIIPMYKESSVTIDNLMNALSLIDYPKEKLDIKIILEEDDLQTIKYIKKKDYNIKFDIIIVPDAFPKTKPKACNYSLYFIDKKAKFLTIYDAEDRPEPLQLRKAVSQFLVLDNSYICLQARLNFYNYDYNILSRCFSVEYSMWFNYFLKSLEYFNITTPLGGTSNHFKLDKLKEIGGWDAFNVTEDADLGYRLVRLGYKTALLDSETLEEAPVTLKNWFLQRSRWIKGYIVTFMVHTRKFTFLINNRYFGQIIGLIFFIGLSSFTYLISFFYLIFSIMIFIFDYNFLYSEKILFIGKINLTLWIVFFSLSALVILKEMRLKNVIIALITPYYYILHCISAVKSFNDFFIKPFYWDKTVHGVGLNKK